MWFRSVPDDSESPFYVFRFRKELNEFLEKWYDCGFLPRILFFQNPPRAEIRTLFGLGSLMAEIKVHGEEGSPSTVVVTSPKAIPITNRWFLMEKLKGLKVRFKVQTR